MGSLKSITFPPGTSRYTQAMAKCLGQAPPPRKDAPDRAVVHLLVNLVQGRMLEYLADQICHEYGIEDEQSKFQIVTALLHIFSDEFFALFRSKIEKKPALAIEIARRIIRRESDNPTTTLGRKWADRLYPAIFRKYFEYRNLEELQQMVESDAEIQKIILLALLRRSLADGPRYAQIASILEQDREGFTTAHFMDQVKHGKVAELLSNVESGRWEAEVTAMRERVAHLRGD